MKLSLFEIHYSRQLSRETNAFSAIVFVNDTAVARVHNDGNGGCNHYSPVTPGARTYAWVDALNANCQAQLELEHDPMATIEPLDQICSRLLEMSLQQKQLVAAAKRASKRNMILFRTEEDLKTPGAYREVKFTRPVPGAEMRAHVLSKHPDATFLIDLKGDPSIDLPNRAEVL